mgnify:CR=1 FL=1
MSEDELESFKILHWLIYFCWNERVFKPLLRYASIELNINPIDILLNLLETKDINLRELFDSMKNESVGEWFDTKEELIDYYNNNVNNLKEFRKLHVWWIAKLYSDNTLLNLLHDNMVFHIENYNTKKQSNNIVWSQLKDMNLKLLCFGNLSQSTKTDPIDIHGKTFYYLSGNRKYINKSNIQIYIYRDKASAQWWDYYLDGDNYSNVPINKFLSALEKGGCSLLNSITIS